MLKKEEGTDKKVMKMLTKPKNIRGPSGAKHRIPAGGKKTMMVKPLIVVKSDSKGGKQLADSRKIAEVEKRLGAVQQHKDRLKERSDKLTTELNKMKSDLNATQQERGRMQQFWSISEMNLEGEKERGRDVEKTLFRLKTHQAHHVQKLQQRIRSLVFNAKTHRHASTQSDDIAPGGNLTSSECQTMEEVNREKAANLLRQSDDLLTVFISELEKEKLSAQSDLKYALVQLEQRMKEEMETQMKTMREEREIEIEEIGLRHIEQIRSIESSHSEETSGLQGKIEFLQKEVGTLRELRDALSQNLGDTREKLTDQANQLGHAQANIDEMSKEIVRLQEYKRDFQRDMRNVESMRKELEKFKELNEIIMGEFSKIETERDELLAEVEKNLSRLDLTNQRKYEEIDYRGKGL